MSNAPQPAGGADAPWTPTPADEQRIAAAQQAARPWWRASRWVAGLQLLLAVVVLGVVISVQLDDDFLIENRYGFLLLGASVVTPFAAGAVLLTGVTLWFVVRRWTAGAILLTCYGVAVAALFGQWGLTLIGDTTTGHKPVLISFAAALATAAAAAAIVGAGTLGRQLKVGRVRDGIGVRTFDDRP